MDPRPDYGRSDYRGSGKLTDMVRSQFWANFVVGSSAVSGSSCSVMLGYKCSP